MTTTEEKLDLFERPKNLSKEFKIFTLNNNLTIEQITSTFININDEWSISNNREGIGKVLSVSCVGTEW